MSDKDLLRDGVRLAMEEAKFNCTLAKGRKKNNAETSSALYGFSKYIEALDDLINNYDFGIFLDNIHAVVKSYLSGQKKYKSTIKKIKQYEETFSKKFLK